MGDLLVADKFPVAAVDPRHSQVIPYRRADINPGVVIGIGPRPFISKHVLPVVNLERTNVFPLGVANAVSFSNGDPFVFKD